MILALNLNASLDKIYTVDKLAYGGVVRAQAVDNTAGGKGMHIANICHILQEDCVVTGFLGGRTGEYIADRLDERQMKHDFVKVAGETRSCINIATADGCQTEVLEKGPAISQQEIQNFLAKYDELLDSADIIAACGSLPVNVPLDFYGTLAQMAKAKGKKFLLDTSGETLRQTLPYKPFMIKPNKDEIEALTGRKIQSVADAAEEVKKFIAMGIEMPIVSLGKEGSVIGCEGSIYHAVPPCYKAVNAVGSGDSFVAGIAIGVQRKYPIADVIKLGSACGTANVLEAESGWVSPDKVDAIFKAVQIEKL